MNSTLIIAKNIKIDKTYNNILSYSSSEMLELVEKNKVAKSTDFSFIRGTGTVKTNFNYSDAIKCNYLAFQNEDFSNKWFFAFIDSVEYKGNNNTIIHYTIDAWSTFYKDIKVTESFVLREHVNDDVIGNYTLNEDIGVGEVICLESETELSVSGDYNFICVMSSYNPATGKDYDGITVYNKEVFGTDLFFIRANTYENIRDLLGFILKTNNDGKINSITNIFYIPQGLLNLSELDYQEFSVGGETFGFYKSRASMTQEIITHNIEKVHSFSDYKPRNNKCFCYPYNYLYVTNNNGANNIYKYEDWSTKTADFNIELALAIGVSGKILPKNYKGLERNSDESIPLGKFPVCGWQADSYTNWLTQQSVNNYTQMLGIGSDVINSVSSKSSENEKGQYTGGINTAVSILNYYDRFRLADLLPNIQGGDNNADVTFASSDMSPVFCKMRVKLEQLKAIDDYFTRFGYKINRVKKPNITGRPYFNYVQIGSSDCIGYGEIPQNYLDIINNIFRNGTTIWHSHANIGDYTLNNK